MEDSNKQLFQKAMKLVAARTADVATRRSVTEQLRLTIEKYRTRFHKSYMASSLGLRDNFLRAAESLELARRGLRSLDDAHTKLFWDVLHEWQQHQEKDLHPAISIEELHPDIVDGMMICEMEELRFMAAIIDTVISPEAPPQGRSRPRLRYLMPTLDLIDLWESIPNAKVVSPKGTSKGISSQEANQPSTEFIRLGLKMISPDATAQNAVTSIRNALKFHKQCVSGASGVSRVMVAFAMARTAERKLVAANAEKAQKK